MTLDQVTLSFHQKVFAIHALRNNLGNFVEWRYDTFWVEEARWYVLADGVSISDGHIIGSAIGRGADPEAALDDLWRQLTEPDGDKRVVIEVPGEARRAARWNGFMWAPFQEEAGT